MSRNVVCEENNLRLHPAVSPSSNTNNKLKLKLEHKQELSTEQQ